MENKILDAFLSMCKNSINEEGIYPHIVVYETPDGQTTITAMALNPEELYPAVKKIMHEQKPIQLIIGMDRSNKEGQDVDMKYHSVLTIAYYAIGKWSVGIMPYASKDEVGDVVWDNVWWNTVVNKELKGFNFLEPSVEDEVIGQAYQEKIAVTAASQTQMGMRYEGFIVHDKLSDDVKEFLRDNSLDINDRKKVISFIQSLGKEFIFTPEDYGFWTLKAGNGIFPARGSKTKVYLEGVEAIVSQLELAK